MDKSELRTGFIARIMALTRTDEMKWDASLLQCFVAVLAWNDQDKVSLTLSTTERKLAITCNKTLERKSFWLEMTDDEFKDLVSLIIEKRKVPVHALEFVKDFYNTHSHEFIQA